jgi:hypothetical protein
MDRGGRQPRPWRSSDGQSNSGSFSPSADEETEQGSVSFALERCREVLGSGVSQGR